MSRGSSRPDWLCEVLEVTPDWLTGHDLNLSLSDQCSTIILCILAVNAEVPWVQEM